MSTRRKSRECSLKMLYTVDNCKLSVESVCKFFDDRYFPNGKVYKAFAMNLFKGVCKNKEKIDSFINQYAKNWELDRMPAVDRNIIRLAIYEIMVDKDTPISVIIDEAIEISKKYSTKDSGKFINGILDKLKFVRTHRDL
ncbi:MAG: transcription antitermination factor NusB [Endomicrobium sp.]|jgi:N utilization substance protein B|nr:transcription antitermination factor NusB [Endomicrobium sp.]